MSRAAKDYVAKKMGAVMSLKSNRTANKADKARKLLKLERETRHVAVDPLKAAQGDKASQNIITGRILRGVANSAKKNKVKKVLKSL